MRLCPPTTALLVGALSLAAPSAAVTAQKAIAEPRAGVAFKPPKGWTELPAAGDRNATVRLFCAPRATSGKEVVVMPLLRVMFFAGGGDDGGDVVDDLPRATPFRSFEDFVRRGYGGQQFEREASEVDGVAGTRWTAGGLSLERALIAQAIPVDGGEAAICFEVVEQQAAKMKREIEGTLSSLSLVPRKAAEREAPPWLDADAWGKLDDAAKRATRRAWAEKVVAAAAADPGVGYKAYESKHWTVLSAADAGFTKKAIAAAEAMREWCAQQMPELAERAPMPAVLRILDDPAQWQGLQTTLADSREYHAHRRELLFARDSDLGARRGYGMLFRAVMWHFFDDVDPGVLPAMPRWFDNGIWEFLRSSECRGRKIEFEPGDVENGRIDYQLRNDSMPAIWQLMQEHIQPSPTDGTNEANWAYTPECARLMRWFWMDGGQKQFGNEHVVADYVRGLGKAYAAVGPDPTRDVAPIGLDEAQQKERNRRYYKWRDAVLIATNDIATPLQPDVWQAVSEKWLAYNRDYK